MKTAKQNGLEEHKQTCAAYLLASDVLAKMLKIQNNTDRWHELASWLRSVALLRPCSLCRRPALLMWDAQHACCSDPQCECPRSDGSMLIADWNIANAKAHRPAKAGEKE